MIEGLRAAFFRPPLHAGAIGSVETKTEAGVQYVLHEGAWKEAVAATAGDIAKVPGNMASVMQEGFYLVGTGDTGCVGALATLGAVYMASMLTGCFLIRAPPAGWAPAGFVAAAGGASAGSVTPAMALRTPQFYLLWT